jgi:O-antigen ligase/polysaccharide polymerase Wzy-like membrane protein
MARAINIPKTHLIMALCLPLAVILGYFLAEPLDSGSLAVVVFVLTVMAVPIVMKWYHPLLILSWNSVMSPIFLPGKPSLWMIMALAALLFALLNRAVSPDHKFTHVGSINRPLCFLLGVVLVTAMVNGGLGIRVLGGERYGGRAYFCIMAAAIGYFAFCSRRIPPEKAALYTGLFFLPGLLPLLSDLAIHVGPAATPIFYLWQPGSQLEATQPGIISAGISRITGFTFAGTALYSFILAKYGFQGVISFKKPFRLLALLLALGLCLACGFRSILILFGFTFIALFFLEGLHRTKWLPASIGVGLICAAALFAFVSHLPRTIQRTISFLPVEVDPLVKLDTQDSTEWRLDMWKDVLPEVPKYLIKGKGYSFDPDDLFWTHLGQHARGIDLSHAGAVLANDFHSGPLSVIIPFGIFGVIGFLWFLGAGMHYLYRCIKLGNPELKRINTFLLAALIGRAALFFIIFGSLYTDLFIFTGIIGLAVSLNGRIEQTSEPEVVDEPEFNAFSSIADGKNSA